jgi:carboxypeptidase family protein/TonB-dependent receptor-like protein
MNAGLKRVVFAAAALLLGATSAFAQQATISGTVTDSSGGVLPGVTITVVHEETGNTFEGLTDAQGQFRIPVRVGAHRLTASLAGFQTVTRTGLQLLLNQTLTVPLQLGPATLTETVTVTGEAPLVDTKESTVGANIDPRQVQDLPINGRNWMDLTLLAPGARRNEGGGLVQNRQGYAQTNVDGQQITTNYHSTPDSEQPQISRDAIAEFQVVANRFDATQGRSSGMVVNAITKSGTNNLTGTFGGYFRNDRFNAKDFILNRVLPYSNQQFSMTLGGPIMRDRLHYFAAYEFEHEPRTFNSNVAGAYAFLNREVVYPKKQHTATQRIDWQLTPGTRVVGRATQFHTDFYNGGSPTSPVGGTRGRIAPQYFGTLTHVYGTSAVNEIKVGRTDYERRDQPDVRWKGADFPYHPSLHGGSIITAFTGLTIGASPLNIFQDNTSIRDDYSKSFNVKGRHDVKMGAEYIKFHNAFIWCLRCDGSINAQGGPLPSPDLVRQMFPDIHDASTWNLAPLATLRSPTGAPLVRWVDHSLSDTEHRYDVTRHIWGAWVQDDWGMTDRLTLNLGVRYDLDSNGHNEKTRFLPWLPGGQPIEKTNFAPRTGFAFKVNDRTAIRGGYGLFYAFAPNDGVQQTEGYLHRFENQITFDGTADFTTVRDNFWGWFHGPKPSFQASLQNACDVVNRTSGCAFRALTQEINYPGRKTSYSHQASVGVQHQIGTQASLEVNYSYTGGRREEPSNTVNANLTYDRATGANIPFTNVAARPFPTWGTVNFELLDGWSNYHGTDVTFTKRFSHRWQANATYTLAFFKDASPVRDQWFLGADGIVARRALDFPLARDLGGEYTYAADDQRHRANVNGVVDLGYGFQLSGIYFYGSGMRFGVTDGTDRRSEGGSGENRLRADGSIVARNNLVGTPIHRVDVRLQKSFPIVSRVKIDGMIETYNLFNHANYGSYTTNLANANFGRPSQNTALAYQPRMMQLGVKVTF